jgi:hypothetical protein
MTRDLASNVSGGAPRGGERATCVGLQGLYARWLACGIVLCAVAAVLCFGQQNGGWIPVNKNLWSLSFVLLLAGFAFIALTMLHVIVDWKFSGRGAFPLPPPPPPHRAPSHALVPPRAIALTRPPPTTARDVQRAPKCRSGHLITWERTPSSYTA